MIGLVPFFAIYAGFVLCLMLFEKFTPRLYESVIGPIAALIFFIALMGVLAMGLGTAGTNAFQILQYSRDNNVNVLVREYPQLSRRSAQTLIEEMGLERAMRILKTEIHIVKAEDYPLERR